MTTTFQPSAPPGPSQTALDFVGRIFATVYGYKTAKAQAKATATAPANTPASDQDRTPPPASRWGYVAAAAVGVTLLVLLIRRK